MLVGIFAQWAPSHKVYLLTNAIHSVMYIIQFYSAFTCLSYLYAANSQMQQTMYFHLTERSIYLSSTVKYSQHRKYWMIIARGVFFFFFLNYYSWNHLGFPSKNLGFFFLKIKNTGEKKENQEPKLLAVSRVVSE